MAITTSFFCNKCKFDSDCEAVSARLATGEVFLRAKCGKCGEKVVRYVTEARSDPYYVRSYRLKEERRKFARDLIQPDDPRFKTYYASEHRKLQVVAEALDRKQKLESKARDVYFKEHSYNVDERKAAMKVLEAEEQLKK